MFVASFHFQIKSLVDSSCVRWKYDVVESCGLPSETSGRTDRCSTAEYGPVNIRTDRIGQERWTILSTPHDATWQTVSVGSLTLTVYHSHNDRTLAVPDPTLFYIRQSLLILFILLLLYAYRKYCIVIVNIKHRIHSLQQVGWANIRNFIGPNSHLFQTFPLLQTTRQSWGPDCVPWTRLYRETL